ncbi:MAG: hypothetical protein ACJ72D_10990, partial [Marmoricola sp.]
VLVLRRQQVAVLALGGPEQADRTGRIGAAGLCAPQDVVAAVESLAATDDLEDEAGRLDAAPPPVPETVGRVVAVWGPAGAPGRTTTAIALAAELAARGRPTLLLDVDPGGGTVAQRLGILDEVSGLLVVARRANTGTLDRETFTAACRTAAAGLGVLTGLPRADRRIEVRPEVVTGLIATAGTCGDVVLDTGAGLGSESDDRDRMTTEALTAADEVVVVGQADPVGLARLARGLVELDELCGPVPVRVVVNRMRPSLGWAPGAVADLVATYAPTGRPVPVHLVVDDPAALDRCLVGGLSLVEAGSSAARKGWAEVARACFPTAFVEPGRSAGRRRRERR